MGLFVSYSSQDRSSLDALTAALRRAQQQVWFDQELGGGESWWSKILEQIRSCELFIVALSNNWLQSKPCQAELRYAQALQRPILPVRIGAIDSVRVNPLAALQMVDYQNPTVDSGIQLITAIHALRGQTAPLPSPLPEEPPVPFAYLMRLGNTLTEKQLSPQQQTQLLVELKSGLDEDGDDPTARNDIAQLLRMLQNRHDVTYRTRSEIDTVLASTDVKSAAPHAETEVSRPQPEQPGDRVAAVDGSTTPQSPTRPGLRGAGNGDGSRRRLMIFGGTGLAAIIAIVVIVVLVTQGSGPTPSSTPSNAQPAPVQPDRLEAMLLGADEVGTIMGANMETANFTQQLRPPSGTLSNPDCLGAFGAIQESAYEGSGFTGVRGQALHTTGDNPHRRIYEAAVSFPSAEKAHAFVTTSADKWQGCAGQPVTIIDGAGKSFQWTFGGLTGAAPRITQQRTQPDANRPACQHVLSAVSDVVIDVEACAVNITDEGSRIADQMAARAKR